MKKLRWLCLATLTIFLTQLCFPYPAEHPNGGRTGRRATGSPAGPVRTADVHARSHYAALETTNLAAALTVTDLGSTFLLRPSAPLASSSGFMKTLGTTGDDLPLSVRQTSDGGFIVSGLTTGVGAGSEDMLLIKFDANGQIEWAKAFGGSGKEKGYSVRQTSEGGYIVAGDTDSFIGVGQFLLVKFDATGAIQWATTGGEAAHSAAGVSVQQTTDGGYIVSGIHSGAIGGLGLFKFDAAGQLQWLRRAFGINFYGQSVQQTIDGGYIVSGSKQGNIYDATLLKFDFAGTLQWAQLGGGGDYDVGLAVQQTSDAGYVIGGITASFGAGGQDSLLLKYDGSGSLQWARTAGGSGDDGADFVQQTADGGYVLSGHTSLTSSGLDALLLKYDGSGAFQWARAGGGSTFGAPVLAQQLGDGGYVLAGSTTKSGAGASDILLVRTDENGDVAGCAGWAPINPSVGTSFQSSATSYAVDSPGFNMSPRTLTVAAVTLTANVACTVKSLTSLSPAHAWIGLKNSDDQGTQFDLRAELYKNGSLVATGTTLCITDVTRNPNLAKNVGVTFGAISDGDLASGDILALKFLTRIGTNPDGSKCPGPGGSHSNATGLRLYYDSVARDSGFGAEITPDPLQSFYLHSTGSAFFFDENQPTGNIAKTRDSGAINFGGENPWKEIGSWSRTMP